MLANPWYLLHHKKENPCQTHGDGGKRDGRERGESEGLAGWLEAAIDLFFLLGLRVWVQVGGSEFFFVFKKNW